MNDNELKALFRQSIDHRLSGLEENPFLAQRIMAAEKGEQPIMKKKVSVSLIAILLIMTLTLSIGYALVRSRITEEMYGKEAVPQEIAQQLQLPTQSIHSALGAVSLDELLYDGNALHTSFTITNPTSESLLYTVDGIWLNGIPLARSTLMAEGAGTSGLLLGGAVDGASLPASCPVYNEGDALYLHDENGTYMGMGPLPEGKASLQISVAVWRPINQPKLVDYRDYEGEDVTETLNCLITDRTGVANLELFRPETLSTPANQRSSQIYADIYRELGWAEYLDCLDLETEVLLNRNQLSSVTPSENEYQIGDLKMTIDRFTLTHAGGQLEGWLYGERDDILRFFGDGLFLADREGGHVLNSGCLWNEFPEGFHFTLPFEPVAGNLPSRVWLAQMVAHDPRWDESSPSYNPSVEKPANVIEDLQLDFSCGVWIELIPNH